MKAVFIDESKSKDYVLCAVFVDIAKVPRIRKELSSMRKSGQSSIHFVKESRSRKNAILGSLARMDFEAWFFVSGAPSETSAREDCLRSLVQILKPNEAIQLFVELDENHRALDKRVLTRELLTWSLSEQISFQHATSSQQQLLWIPDALAWVRTRGGEWGRGLSRFRVNTIICD